MGTRVISELDRGLVALLSSKSSEALLRFAGGEQVVFFCISLTALFRAVPSNWHVIGRISVEMTQTLLSIAYNIVLQEVASSLDAGLDSVILLAVYFWSDALDPTAWFSTTAEYLLVSVLAGKLQGQALLLAWAIAFIPRQLIPSNVTSIAQLLVTQTLTDFLALWMPRSLLVLSTVIMLYLCAPFTEILPVIHRLYRFSVFALFNDSNLLGVPSWLIAAVLWAIWQTEPEPIARRLVLVAGVNISVLVVLDAMRFATDNDPFPTLIALLTAVRIVEGNMDKRGRT